jgi:mRNA-degrading endonuclease RelE of RelBE toxin-antitoxin system
VASLWKIEILTTAQRELDQIADTLGNDVRKEILEDILDLQDDPRPAGSVHLRGTKDFYRIYTYRSMYRIVYRVLFGKRTVLVERIRPRPSAYSGLDRW